MEPLYRQFGAQLKQARRKARMTQRDVAERVNLTRTSITNIESGRQHVALHQVFLLAGAIGCEVVDLLPDGDVPIEDLLPPEVVRMLPEDPEQRHFAARIIGKGADKKEEVTK